MENKTPELMVLPAAVLQNALNYLATRPYNETAKLIEDVIKSAAKVAPPAPKSEESTEKA
jgi:hypothetical protein